MANAQNQCAIRHTNSKSLIFTNVCECVYVVSPSCEHPLHFQILVDFLIIGINKPSDFMNCYGDCKLKKKIIQIIQLPYLFQEHYKKPVISTVCWHVHCEECWLHTLVKL